MPGLNCVTLVGEIRNSPDLEYTKSGLAICTVPIFVETVTRFEDKAKERKDAIDVKVFGKSGELAANLCVGAMVAVLGRVGSRSYDDKNGNKRIAIEIVANSIEPLDATNTPAPGGKGKQRRREEPPSDERQPEPEPESGPQNTY